MEGNLAGPWDAAYASFWSVFSPCFTMQTSFERGKSYVRGLMGKVERKNGWQLAEYAGDSEAVFRQLLTPDFQSGAPR